MSDSVFVKVSQLFQTPGLAVQVANAFDLAYHKGCGTPENHVPFDFPAQGEMVAVNLAGLYATDTAANLIAAARDGLRTDGTVDEFAYVSALEAIADGDLSAEERFVAENCANLSWRQGNAMRGLASSPLARTTRGNNVQWNQLPGDERAKDLVQIVTGANVILNWINDGVVQS